MFFLSLRFQSFYSMDSLISPENETKKIMIDQDGNKEKVKSF